MKESHVIRRKIELFMIFSYVLSGIYVGKAIQNFVFVSISNIWISLLFLSPLVLAGISAVLYKRNKTKNIPLAISSFFWLILAAPKLFDDVSRSRISILFFSFMASISLSHLIFLAYYKNKKKEEEKNLLN